MLQTSIQLLACLTTLSLSACGGGGSNDQGEGADEVETGSSESASETNEGESGTAEGESSGDATESESSSDDATESETSSDDATEAETSSDDATEETETSDGGNCMATEPIEVTCDGLDNDCDDVIDNVDVGNDGFCDCLAIGILGATGFAPTSDFEAWLEMQGTSVSRHLLANNPGVVTPELLSNYDLILIDRIERALSPDEAAAIEAFVKDEGRGLITLIGYNFDNGNPGPERDRANTVLAPFGLAYQGGYIHTVAGVTPTFDQQHPISMGISQVNFHGGIVPVDLENQGMSTIFATVPSGDAGLAHETVNDSGRVIVWGDEWVTFDSDWQGFADVDQFWAQMVAWAKPKQFCGDPQ